jgi:cytochrome c5
VRRALAGAAALLAVCAALPGCGAVGDDDAPVAAVAPAVAEAHAEAAPAVPYAVAPAADSTPAAAPLVDRAREIIRPSCGTCHTASSPQANPKALAIYDLDRADWGATMSHAQLESFRKRVAGKTEWAGEPRATLDAYVDELLARPAP